MLQSETNDELMKWLFISSLLDKAIHVDEFDEFANLLYL